MNLIVIKGRLTNLPEMKYTPNGVAVTTFNVAVNRSYNKEEVDFFTVVAWRNTAEFVAKYFEKGQEILVRGEMQQRSYEDKDGNKRYVWEVKADNVEFCGSKGNSNGNGTARAEVTTDDEPVFEAVSEEEAEGLPF